MNFVNSKKIKYTIIAFMLIIFIFYIYTLLVKYSDEDITGFNEYLAKKDIILSEDNVTEYYFKFRGFDSISSSETSVKEYDWVKRVTSIPVSTKWDSVSSIKYIFDIDTTSNIPKISQMKRTWKCHKWRWHRYWSSTSCF